MRTGGFSVASRATGGEPRGDTHRRTARPPAAGSVLRGPAFLGRPRTSTARLSGTARPGSPRFGGSWGCGGGRSWPLQTAPFRTSWGLGQTQAEKEGPVKIQASPRGACGSSKTQGGFVSSRRKRARRPPAHYSHRNLPETASWTARNRLCKIRNRAVSAKVGARSGPANTVS